MYCRLATSIPYLATKRPGPCCLAGPIKGRYTPMSFWNPFHLAFDAFGRLFAVDNNPDSRPPCRLLHTVEGGDYGYRFRNGHKGV